jgi:hypothetical protein
MGYAAVLLEMLRSRTADFGQAFRDFNKFGIGGGRLVLPVDDVIENSIRRVIDDPSDICRVSIPEIHWADHSYEPHANAVEPSNRHSTLRTEGTPKLPETPRRAGLGRMVRAASES